MIANNDGTVAAKVCDDYTMTVDSVTYDDWFLPSKDELDLMYDNLKANNLGSFSDYYYWSSSEDSDLYAWRQYFPNGGQFSGNKSLGSRVRPMRAF